ncbi:MAG: aspartate kinase [Phycisphaeraceae bacterium]
MTTKVCKFGGSSLADAGQIDKVRRILAADPQRRYVVPSAPGKRHGDDQKITDLLYLCHEHARQGLPFDDVFALVSERYQQIVAELGRGLDIAGPLEEIKQHIASVSHDGGEPDYAASRGEYLNALVIAELLGWEMIDAAELIFFDERGRLDERRTYDHVQQRLASVDHAVIPGFYGQLPDGRVKTFSRGGSDVTGAIIARGVAASVYENWTDVDGLLMADPRIVDNPRIIESLTYKELRELAYMGATVLHDEAVFPVREVGIPVNIRNTNKPDAPGTTIFRGDGERIRTVRGEISGIAGRKDFTVIALEKAMMNAELGFGRRVLTVLEANDVNFEHMPSSIDTLSIVVADAEVEGKLEPILEQLRAECHPDAIETFPDMALIATVGRGMAHTPGMAAKLFGSLAAAGINIRMIDQGASELNIIVGVAADDFEATVRAIYHAFVE